MMKTFEEIYRDAAVRNGCNAGKTFARVMFEEGMSQNLERCMDRAAGSHTDLMAFAGWFGKRLARESVRCNATRVNFSGYNNRRQEIHHPVRYGHFQHGGKEKS